MTTEHVGLWAEALSRIKHAPAAKRQEILEKVWQALLTDLVAQGVERRAVIDSMVAVSLAALAASEGPAEVAETLHLASAAYTEIAKSDPERKGSSERRLN